MKLTVNIAARLRPELLIETIEKTLPNIVLPNTTLMVSVDHDDPETVAAADKFANHSNVLVCVGPREDSVGGKYNRALSVAPADVYVMQVDHAPFLTKGFDEKFIEAAARYRDGYAVLVTSYANLSFPSTLGVTAKYAAAVGELYTDLFPYWFIDHWLDDVAQMIQRRTYVDVHVDWHSLRFRNGAHRTHEKRHPPFWATFYDVTAPLREAQAMAIINREDFEETKDRKAALPYNFKTIHHHSRMVNDGVRQDTDPGPPPDERYLRAVKRAVEITARLAQQQRIAA